MRALLPLLLVVAAPLAAQSHQAATRTIADSLRAETCRGGTLSASGLTCRGATYATRVTVIRRLANRLDSLEAAPPPTSPDTGVARVEIALRATTSVLWPMGHVGALPTADALLCALVETDGQQYLGTPAVLATIVAPDSIAWHEAAVSGNADALRRECARDLPTWPVTWASVRVTFAAVPAAIPVASAVVP